MGRTKQILIERDYRTDDEIAQYEAEQEEVHNHGNDMRV